MTDGWQQPEEVSPRTCPHLGILGAALSTLRHPVGHEWRCSCGQVFRLTDVDGRKVFRKVASLSVTPAPSAPDTDALALAGLPSITALALDALESLDLLCRNEETHGDSIRAHEVRDAVRYLAARVRPR